MSLSTDSNHINIVDIYAPCTGFFFYWALNNICNKTYIGLLPIIAVQI